MARSKSSGRWLAEHHSDQYVKQARAAGYRSRAAFKLAQIQAKDRILRPGMTIVDLGAAPGGWSQCAAEILKDRGHIVALDILLMEPLSGVTFLQGDFRDAEPLVALEDALGGRAPDLVLSDMAPNMSGVGSADQAAALYLAELARDFALQHLRSGGDFLVKIFQGEGFDAYLKSLRAEFKSVAVRKPEASRARSAETYLLARGLKQRGGVN
ncbi:MAG: 23S rRNA (uridine(2552)-2'-O)-methyltransferase RlmE [Nevskiales bacterium]